MPVCFHNVDPKQFSFYSSLIDNLRSLESISQTLEELLDNVRGQYKCDASTLQEIANLEKQYHSSKAVEFYTRDVLMFHEINQALLGEKREAILHYRSRIIDVHDQLADVHKRMIQLMNHALPSRKMCYCGQLMSSDTIDLFRQQVEGLAVTRAFWSTTYSMDTAMTFAASHPIDFQKPLIRVIFHIDLDFQLKTRRPFAPIVQLSYSSEEDEVLISVGSIFRIHMVAPSPTDDDIQIICLVMVDESEIPQKCSPMALDVLCSESDETGMRK